MHTDQTSGQAIDLQALQACGSTSFPNYATHPNGVMTPAEAII
jgi:hypothetical protein